jgi:hypothetical protein
MLLGNASNIKQWSKSKYSRALSVPIEDGSVFNVEHPRKFKTLSFHNPPMFSSILSSAMQSCNTNRSNSLQGACINQRQCF